MSLRHSLKEMGTRDLQVILMQLEVDAEFERSRRAI